MPGYSGRRLIPVVFSVNGTQTATASNHVVSQAAAATFPAFPKHTQIFAVVVKVKTAPNAGATNSKLAFLNGTTTFAVATIGTKTAGQSVEAAVTRGLEKIAEDVAPTITLIGTATASNTVDSGTYDVFIEV